MAKRNFKLLVPLNYLRIEDSLLNSLKNTNLLSHIIIIDDTIIDGIKRYFILKKLKKKMEFKEMEGDPFFLRFHLNIERKWTLPEIAYTYLNSSEKLKKEILKAKEISFYPEIEKIFKLLLSVEGLIKLSILNKINISTLNDLIFWGEKAFEISEKFSKMEGTFSEFKNVSVLLRKAKLEGMENFKFKKKAKDMENYLKKILYPNYTKDLKKFKDLLKKLKVPKDIKIKEFEFFEEKAIEIFIKLNGKNEENVFDWLFENKENIKNILKKMP